MCEWGGWEYVWWCGLRCEKVEGKYVGDCGDVYGCC